MRCSKSVVSAIFSILLVLLFLPAAVAAGPPTVDRQDQVSVVEGQEPGAVPIPGEKKVLTIDEYARWRSVVSTAISADGAWVAFGYRKREADDVLTVRRLDDGVEHTIERASSPVFSDDSRWVAYELALGWQEIEKLEKDGDPVSVQVELLDLADGTRLTWDDIDRFEIARGSLALAVKRKKPDTGGPGGSGGGRGSRGNGRAGGGDDDGTPRGTDLIIRYLAGGTEELLGSVDQFAFNKPGTHLAFTVDAADDNGNGVYLLDLSTGARVGLDNARSEYARLTWDKDGTSLAVLRGSKPEGQEERANVLLAFPGVVGNEDVAPTAKIVYDPAEDDTFTAGLVISERGELSWSRGATKIFLGVKEQMAEPEKTDEPIADVNVFHWRDERVQWQQKVQAERDRGFTYRSVLNVDAEAVSGTFVRLADERMRVVNPTKDGRWAIGEDDKDYISDWKPRRADYYRIDTASGERTLMLEGLESRHVLGASPDGEHWLYWKDEQVRDWRLASGDDASLTAASAAGDARVSFVNTEWDYFGTAPPWGVAGWVKDGGGVVLNHQYDLYLQSFGGGPAVNLTAGAGDRGEIRFRYVDLDPERQGGLAGGFRRFTREPAEIDLAEPMLLSAFGRWTKRAGYFELAPGGGEPMELVWADKYLGRVTKARDADRFLYTVEDFTAFPDVYVSDRTFESPVRVTDANPWQDEYLWGHRILFEYTNDDGVRLQGTLAIPDDYVDGEKRPMIVRFYEKYSQDLHRYPMPIYRHSPNFAGYVSAGYLIMQPDVHFRGGTSHSDMLECIEAATRKVIELGYADPGAIGLSGHSYSGGGSSYIAGRSKMFAAVASGAAPINLTSEFNQIFLSSGQNNHGYDIYGQGRYGTDPYDDPDLYEQESPITWARDMDTPLLYLHGEADPTVGYVQATEWYNALRFNDKPIIFLSYPGEGHGLRKFENQIDFQRRLRQFFGHHLRDDPAPEWMTRGVPYLEKERSLRRRRE